MRFKMKAAMAAILIAGVALTASAPASAQYAVTDAQTHMGLSTVGSKVDSVTSRLIETNKMLADMVEVQSATARLMNETAANTASSLDQMQRLVTTIADPREKASRREQRQKWLLGAQGYGTVAAPADAARPLGSSWALRMNQPRTDGSDVRASMDVLADPGIAARYSRQAYGISGAVANDRSMVGRAQVEQRRRAEAVSATHDAHGMALYSTFATSATFRKIDRFATMADEAYEMGLADQLYVLNLSILGLLEESASQRALIGQDVRMRAASTLVASPVVGSTSPDLVPPGQQAGAAWEYGAAGTGNAIADPLPTLTSGGAAAGPQSFAEALDAATSPGDYASGLGGMAGLGCPYGNMQGSRMSGCARGIAQLLLGATGADYQTQRTIMGMMTGGLSGRSLGTSGRPLDMRQVANMFGLGGLMSCFGGNASSCSYACQRLATERLPGGRCAEGGYDYVTRAPDNWGSGNSFGGGRIGSEFDLGYGSQVRGRYCVQLRRSCESEGMPALSFDLGFDPLSFFSSGGN
ncbi:MAG: hypothetical protein IBJ15_04785 [Alphaproteobacteria bacterium]|nr:hypothetical protein [Alphaproteobacteria bacterium]